ncbi:MAG: paraquat-inducible protein A [Gammaproteobacteria bacterium]|nr:paraquat-inducible protein A [Gammaproteobacteria bacterium]
MALTAKEAGLVGCTVCGLLAPVAKSEGEQHCERCGEKLHTRHPDSIQRTWALLIAAIIFYIPANLMPITLTTALGNTQGDTIMEGVIYFMYHGEWPIGLVIFIASIFVPICKIAAMIYLLISVQRQSDQQRLNRAKIYRIVELVGRWSMIDIFVVTIMVALVQLGFLASVQAGSGAIFFCAVVIITMFAAESFDPRLIWDKQSNDD